MLLVLFEINNLKISQAELAVSCWRPSTNILDNSAWKKEETFLSCGLVVPKGTRWIFAWQKFSAESLTLHGIQCGGRITGWKIQVPGNPMVYVSLQHSDDFNLIQSQSYEGFFYAISLKELTQLTPYALQPYDIKEWHRLSWEIVLLATLQKIMIEFVFCYNQTRLSPQLPCWITSKKFLTNGFLLIETFLGGPSQISCLASTFWWTKNAKNCFQYYIFMVYKRNYCQCSVQPGSSRSKLGCCSLRRVSHLLQLHVVTTNMFLRPLLVQKQFWLSIEKSFCVAFQRNCESQVHIWLHRPSCECGRVLAFSIGPGMLASFRGLVFSFLTFWRFRESKLLETCSCWLLENWYAFSAIIQEGSEIIRRS